MAADRRVEWPRPGGWSGAQRRLHWTHAVLIVLAFSIAWMMVGVSLDALLLKFVLFQIHKTLGLLALAVALARLGLRLARRRPPWDPALPAWQRKAAQGTHLALYGLFLLVPVLGYLVACTAPLQIPTLFLGVIPIPSLFGVSRTYFVILFAAHRTAAIALIVLACGHALAAVHNQRRGIPVLSRMWSG